MHVLSSTFFLPASSIDVKIKVRNAKIRSKDFLIAVQAFDPIGTVIDPKMLSWSYSASLKTSFQYIPDYTGTGIIEFPTLKSKKRIGSITFTVKQWGKQPNDLELDHLILASNKGNPGSLAEFGKLIIAKEEK